MLDEEVLLFIFVKKELKEIAELNLKFFHPLSTTATTEGNNNAVIDMLHHK